MNILRLSLQNPIAIVSGIVIIFLLGIKAFFSIPIQLSPNIDRSIISIRTHWPGASPLDIEQKILRVQQDALQGIPGMLSMTGIARKGRAYISLEFANTADLNRCFLIISSRLQHIHTYPEDAHEPFINTANEDNPSIAWFSVQQINGANKEVHEFADLIENHVKQELERIVGISEVNVFGIQQEEILITIDPLQLARYKITVETLLDALRNADISVSLGQLNEGKRQYSLRFENRITTLEDIHEILIRFEHTENTVSRVLLKDIAFVELKATSPSSISKAFGAPTIGISLQKENNINVVETMNHVKTLQNNLNNGILKEKDLRLFLNYNEAQYIEHAIDLVINNIYIGSFMATLLLFLTLKTLRPVFIILITIPLSVFTTVTLLSFFNTGLNVMSLAGIAFAVGMTIDSSIVVLESIFQYREKKFLRLPAAYEGTRRVWQATFISTLTTIMAFIPIFLIQLEIGQLFYDIAFAIAISVLVSFGISMTVIPVAARYMLGSYKLSPLAKTSLVHTFLRKLQLYGEKFVDWIMKFVLLTFNHQKISLMLIGLGFALLAILTFLFMPKLEFLPEGNRNFIQGFLSTPLGYNLPTREKIASDIEQKTLPYWPSSWVDAFNTQRKEQNLPPIPLKDPKNPDIESFFYYVADNSHRIYFNSVAQDSTEVSRLIQFLQSIAFQEPGVGGSIQQSSIFSASVGGERSIALDISGAGNMQDLIDLAKLALQTIAETFPPQLSPQVQPRPRIEQTQGILFKPHPYAFQNKNLTPQELANAIHTFYEGTHVMEISMNGHVMDMRLSGPPNTLEHFQDFEALPLVLRDGTILPLSSFIRLHLVNEPSEILHLDNKRSIRIHIRPHANMSLHEATEILHTKIIPVLKQQQTPHVNFQISGASQTLETAQDQILIQFLFALLIVYLIIAIQFKNFVYPLLIMLATPLALFGALLLFTLMKSIQPLTLDMLSLLGFIILAGIVVNNAILLVDKGLYNYKIEKMSSEDSILDALKSRIRPIFMSSGTSILGMLPLVLFSGAGSELYRGIGIIVLGGLTVSSLLLLFIFPILFYSCMSWIEKRHTSVL